MGVGELGITPKDRSRTCKDLSDITPCLFTIFWSEYELNETHGGQRLGTGLNNPRGAKTGNGAKQPTGGKDREQG